MRALGDRMKRYEKNFSGHLVKKVPAIIRVDGRAFHTFCKDFERPFDDMFMTAMVLAARETMGGIQGCKAAYIQSDEVTFLLTDYAHEKQESWFSYDVQKMVSITAATMSVEFNKHIVPQSSAVFDARAFSVPREDVVNAFLWRAKDFERNSLSMFARAHFSHKKLLKKRRADIHEMLHEKGLNWATDTTPQQRNGTFIIVDQESPTGFQYLTDVLPHYKDIKAILEKFL